MCCVERVDREFAIRNYNSGLLQGLAETENASECVLTSFRPSSPFVVGAVNDHRV